MTGLEFAALNILNEVLNKIRVLFPMD